MVLKTKHFDYHFIPAKRKSEHLMIVLHGRGDSLDPFKKFDSELKIENVNYLLLNAPRKYLDGFSWYGEPPHIKQGVLKIRNKIFDILKELESLGWKSENIFLFGFSQGCLVSADIAMHYPRRLGGVVGVSGYFCFFPRWKRSLIKPVNETPWLMLHGTRDDILPIQDTKFGVDQLKKNGLNIDWVEFDKDHSLIEEEYPIIKRWVQNQMSSL
ncbi:MAG TPA: serine esterase [Pseudobdellovibrionaceae bacterium]|nr:serine esterase [Pseudobdellovibrionaceae bacterium]